MEVTKGRGLKSTTIPLDPQDAAQARSCRESIRSMFLEKKEDLRTTFDRYTSMTPEAPGVRFEEAVEPVRGCWSVPRNARAHDAILYLHGGAYLIGSAKAYRGFCSQIACRASISVFALDYPLTPESPFPGAYDYCFKAVAWLEQQGIRRLAVCGDSAGGGLALAAAAGLVERQRSDYFPHLKLSKCVVFSPWTDLTISGSTINFPDPLMQLAAVQKSAQRYLRHASPLDPRASPLFGIAEGMPPILIQVAQDELLLDDSRRYAKAAAERGAEVQLEIWQDLHHVFQLCTEQLFSARAALDRVAEFLRRP